MTHDIMTFAGRRGVFTLPRSTVEMLADRWLKGLSCLKIGAVRGIPWTAVWDVISAVEPWQVHAVLGDCRRYIR